MAQFSWLITADWKHFLILEAGWLAAAADGAVVQVDQKSYSRCDHSCEYQYPYP